jgi:hypothetical protein
VQSKGIVTRADGRYFVTANDGSALTVGDIKVYAVLGDQVVETTRGYKVVVATDGKSAEVVLGSPAIGAVNAEAGVENDEDDPSGMLVVVDDSKIAAKPTTKNDEVVRALPVKACAGLYYQAAWGDDLGSLTEGDKVQAKSATLYLGVIKQTGDKGFYRVQVSDR